MKIGGWLKVRRFDWLGRCERENDNKNWISKNSIHDHFFGWFSKTSFLLTFLGYVRLLTSLGSCFCISEIRSESIFFCQPQRRADFYCYSIEPIFILILPLVFWNSVWSFTSCWNCNSGDDHHTRSSLPFDIAFRSLTFGVAPTERKAWFGEKCTADSATGPP